MLFLGFIADAYSLSLFYQKKSNFLFYNIFLLIETITIYYFFSFIFKSLLLKKILFVLGIIFTVFWTFSLFKFGSQSYFWGCNNFENITILPIAIFYYYEEIIIINSVFIYAESVFWIVAAYFIYFSGTFFLYLYIPTLNTYEQTNYYNMLNSVFIIIRTVLLSVAVFMKPPLRKIDNNKEGIYK